MVIRFIKMFWDLCMLKAQPQDLPTSTFLLGITLMSYFLTGIAVAALQWPLPFAFFIASLDAALISILCYVLLWARMFSVRFTQTLTALTGSGTLLGIFAIPLIVWQQQMGAPSEGLATIPAALLLVWMAWNITVMGHILRHALSTAFFLGLGLAALYAYITLQLIRAFLPS